MADEYSIAEARAVLADVQSDKVFFLKDGSSIRSLKELYSVLRSMDDSVFSHHVNSGRNDFGSWVRDVHKDYRLANSLFSAKSRDEVASAVGGRIYELEKCVEKASCTALVVPSEESSAAAKLEMILSGAKAEMESGVKGSSSVTAQQLISESAAEEPSQSSFVLPAFSGSLGSASRFFREVSSIFSASTLSAIGRDMKSLLPGKEKDDFAFIRELSSFSAYSGRNDKKGEMISHLKRVYK